MPSVTREVSLTEATLKELLKTTIDGNLDQTATKDIEANDTLKEINKTLKTIKEQNDEIIGDTF